METNLEGVKSKESVKLKEIEKITTAANNNKTTGDTDKDTGERESKKTETQT